jgi:hypothetical protein
LNLGKGPAAARPKALCKTTVAIGITLAVTVSASAAGADGPPIRDSVEPADVEILNPHRFEFAGFPIIGGNTDIGVLFGVAGTLSRFEDPIAPYLWNLDVVVSVSAKSEPDGLGVIQQNQLVHLDAVRPFGPGVRVDALAGYTRTINAGYYGVGNATTAALAPGETPRRYQYVQQEARFRAIGRTPIGRRFDLVYGGNLRDEVPRAYDGSKLAEEDQARGDGGHVLRGLTPALLGAIGVGVLYDTRDTEFVTRRGILYELSVGAALGTEERVRYGNSQIALSHYTPLVGPLTFASRFLASFQIGDVPFYDLAQGGVFVPSVLFGGDSGVRGVPQARYAGLVKVLSNTEIRTVLPRFRLFGQRFRVGTTTFVDAGRVFADYHYDPARDGRKLGLKYGIGGGIFAQWGEAAIFRIEAAYSPDAVAENPGFPVGIYVAEGLIF